MKKTIITILLVLVAMAGQAKKTIVWENPSVCLKLCGLLSLTFHGVQWGVYIFHQVSK